MPLSAAAKISFLVTLGIFFAILGLLSYILFPRILQWQVEENLILTPDAEPFEYWKDVPVPIYCRFYFFNITNALEVETLNKKPELKELGPYTFREARKKINITWNGNGTVSYKQIKTWFFDPDETVGSLDDMITTVNVPVVTAANKAKILDDEYFTQAIDSILAYANSTVFIKQPVRNLLFEGYSEDLISIAKTFGIEAPFEKFGWFYSKNNSDDGHYTIYTGQSDVDSYGHIDKWNGLSNFSYGSPPCNIISGTAGDMWPPFRKSRADKLELFVSDICSVLHLSFQKDVKKGNIDSFRYWLDANTFEHSKGKTNKCCTDVCLPHGVLDIQDCQHGAPAIVSFPHYLYADSMFHQKVVGLNPDPKKHTFIIDLEPKLGVPVNVEAKLQINVAVPKVEGISLLSFPNDTIFYPIFWFDESASINFETAEKIKFVTKLLPQYVTIVAFIFVILGGLILILTLHSAVRLRKTSSKQAYSSVRVLYRGKS